jgi:two-component system, NarL family, nitrate/nitrite response regulator NarL
VDDQAARLTLRQQQIAALVAEGLTNTEIAQRLNLSAGTIANRVRQINKRLHLKGRVRLAVWAVENGVYRSQQRH